MPPLGKYLRRADNGRLYGNLFFLFLLGIVAILHIFLPSSAEWLGIAAILLVSIWIVIHFELRTEIAFVLPLSAVLAVSIVSVATRDMPFIYTPDSFGYLDPGLRIASGAPLIGHPFRALGYPALIAILLTFSKLRALPVMQLILFIVGIGALATILVLFLNRITETLAEAGGWLGQFLRVTIVGVAGSSYGVLIVSHDGSILNIYRLMAEMPHMAFSALGLLCFTVSWLVRSSAVRIPVALAAVGITFFSTLIKPMTLLPFALTVASALWILWRERRNLRTPANLFAVLASLFIVGGSYAANSRITAPQEKSFGPQTLFCNHIAVVLPVVGDKTPERAALSRLLEGVLALGPHGWPTLGQDGDQCLYNVNIFNAINRVVDSEHAEFASWLTATFLSGVMARPVVYAHTVSRQLARYFHGPVGELSLEENGTVADVDWDRIEQFAGLFGTDRAGFSAHALNWIARDFPSVTLSGKVFLENMERWFTPTVLFASALAGFSLTLRRHRVGAQPEAIVLCIGSFIFSYALVIAFSHTFDIGRYAAEMLPLAILWLLVSAAYIPYAAIALVVEFGGWRASSSDRRSGEPL